MMLEWWKITIEQMQVIESLLYIQTPYDWSITKSVKWLVNRHD
jgi:hypothetical protein